ncbi:response regulator transcription factor [Pseudoflavitalea sp. G-6-1-2]|uniref:response regulator transcription factor n=1 Tax=Pseudoflavitalea sp. G-6-1-2 TaxID=2728841 RepID=UPI00146F76C6|nr:response regulator transcription factor [Pseudoflavitalea sp. G-6-1-2]NML22113.1 response regulator transcription factor [Pseudoflavitalea sp. G-6-1-2]
MTILIIEDEQKVASFIKKGLEEQQFTVEVENDGERGLQTALEKDFDCIILDILLPGINGREICRRLRQNQVWTPVLMLSALQTTDDIVTGLDHGADDYLRKPFHFKELLARIQALHRRHHQDMIGQERLQFQDLILDTAAKSASRSGIQIVLTAREYKLLELFMRHPNKVLSRAFISDAVWGIDRQSNANVVDVYVNYLRNKIEKPFHGDKLIHTLTGMGYVLKPSKQD